MAETKPDQVVLAPRKKGMVEPTVQMNMRVTPEVRDLLVEIANHKGLSMRDAVEAAIKYYHRKKLH